MSRQRASCLISEEFVGCPQAWAAGRAKHGGGGAYLPLPLLSADWPPLPALRRLTPGGYVQ